MRNEKPCNRCDWRGPLSCFHCKYNISPIHELLRQNIRDRLQPKTKVDPVVEEYNRMTEYLRNKYGERNFEET